MKVLLLILCVLSTISNLNLNAQNQSKQKEVGLSLRNLNNFGLTYKFGSINSLWRINSALLNANTDFQKDDEYESDNKSFGVSFKFGKEWRNSFNDNLEFRIGSDLSFDFHHSESIKENKLNDQQSKAKSTIYRPGIFAVIGLNYLINEKIVLGLEISPGMSYHIGTQEEKSYTNENTIVTDKSGFNLGISNSSALLTLSYRL